MESFVLIFRKFFDIFKVLKFPVFFFGEYPRYHKCNFLALVDEFLNDGFWSSFADSSKLVGKNYL